jgi:SAM-dependent methyltransferase
VALQDFAPIAALSDSTLAGLRRALAESGLGARAIDPIVQATRSLHPLLRRPALHHAARRMREPFAVAARAFMFGDVVSEQDLVGLGLDLAPLRDSGLLVERGGGLASPFTMSLIDGLFILADPLEHGGDAVMGMGPLTVPLCAAAKPLRPIGRALDLGCGAGVVALLLSRRAVKVVATDINPRAVAMTRFNARLNALENVEVREGSLFEPVARERFDLIASQPPFIPQPEGATAGDFMTGGSLGDELSKKLMEVLPDHLVEGGLGVLVIEWAHGPTHAAPFDRVSRLLDGAPADVLFFEYAPLVGAAHAIEYAAALHPHLDEAFDAEAHARLAHFDAVGIESLVPSCLVLRRVDDRKPRAQRLSGNAIGLASSERIASVLRGPEIVKSPSDLLDATLRLVPGTILHKNPDPDATQRAVAELPPAAMLAPVPLEDDVAKLLAVFESPTRVKAALDAHARTQIIAEPPQVLARKVAFALLGGLLEEVE